MSASCQELFRSFKELYDLDDPKVVSEGRLAAIPTNIQPCSLSVRCQQLPRWQID